MNDLFLITRISWLKIEIVWLKKILKRWILSIFNNVAISKKREKEFIEVVEEDDIEALEYVENVKEGQKEDLYMNGFESIEN